MIDLREPLAARVRRDVRLRLGERAAASSAAGERALLTGTLLSHIEQEGNR